ncbi:hypothetical protein [Amycolatopsis sp.]|uniref:hypothetical protein n=1 Tax=Amycolatopsis sp. TaxID=37632 RepID=UPI002D1052F1|nr:hypothetical protein [Amycolatopsis sp.]HVV10703.1 hypothetical protein [Amycolatopsis sp.]
MGQRRLGSDHEPAPVRRPTLVIHGAEDADNLPETSAGRSGLFPDGYRRVVLDGVGTFHHESRRTGPPSSCPRNSERCKEVDGA